MPTVERKHGVSRGTIGADNKYTSTETWIVTAAPLGTYNHYTVCLLAGLPAIGDRDSSGIATCKSKASKLLPDKDQTAWEVDCEYEYSPTERKDQNPNDPNATNPDPEQRTPQYRWGFVRHDRVFERDALDWNKAVVNSRGDRFPRPVMLTGYYLTLDVSSKKLTFDANAWHTKIGCINSDQVQLLDSGNNTIAPKHGKLVGVSAQEHYEGDWAGYLITCSLEIDYIPWNPVRIVDEGWFANALGPAGTYIKKPATDALGRPAGRVVNLDGSGHEKSDEGLAANGLSFVEYNGYREIPMNGFLS